MHQENNTLSISLIVSLRLYMWQSIAGQIVTGSNAFNKQSGFGLSYVFLSVVAISFIFVFISTTHNRKFS